MSDRGAKIVHLAQELLRDGTAGNIPENKQPSDLSPDSIREKSEAIKAACLAALIAALGSAGVTHAVDEMKRPINRYERVEIEALVFYAARQLGRNETDVRNEIQKNLSVGSVQDFTADDYRRVRDYLWTRLAG